MRTNEIEHSIDSLETANDVSVLFACESGSRAWGFASTDSDFDVRFIYVRPRDWYLSVDLEVKPDVIELPISDALDINGWDLRKALKLLRKSNPPLLEWLGSPIVYRETGRIPGELRRLIGEYYSPRACMHHYRAMAQGNFREFLQHETVWTKKYFYVLRPVLAVQWIERGYGVVPTEFQVLVDRLLPHGALRDAVDALLHEKRAGNELDEGPRIDVLHNFLESELARTESVGETLPIARPSTDELDEVFRAALNETTR